MSAGYWWGLVSIDQGCSEFARLIDSEGGVEETFLLFGKRAAPFCGSM